MLSSDSRNWFDADLIPGTSTISGVVLPTNGTASRRTTRSGRPRARRSASGRTATRRTGIQNVYNWEYTAVGAAPVDVGRVGDGGVLPPDLARTCTITDRTQITNADYTSFTTKMPDFSNDPTLIGVLDPNEILTIYNLNSAKRSVYGAAQVDYNSTGTFDRRVTRPVRYNGVEVSFSARLPKGTIFGGWTIERNVARFCDNNDNPNGISGSRPVRGQHDVARRALLRSVAVRRAVRARVQAVGHAIRCRTAIDFGAVLQAYPGADRTITWQPAASLFPGGRTNSETIVLTEPGSLYQPRYNQVDINFKKNFRSGSKRFSLQVDLFNVLNSNAIFGDEQRDRRRRWAQVTAILQGRMPRLAFQMQW